MTAAHDRDAAVERIVATRNEQFKSEADDASPETAQEAVAQLRDKHPALFSDLDYAFMADRRIHELLAAGVPEPEAILRGGASAAERLGISATDCEPQSATSEIIDQMRAARPHHRPEQ